jgi:DNA-binding transcriptional regulator PaaX
MRKKNREKIVDFSTSALKLIFRLGGATTHAFLNRRDLYNHLNNQGFSRTIISGRIRDLINSGYIEAIEESGQRSVQLTRKGKIRLLENSSNDEIDGEWRFISFDVPEKLKTQRFALTRSLRRIGYKPIQKSLWACPYNKADEIDLLISELGLDQYVANFKTNKTDINNHLKELFDDVL